MAKSDAEMELENSQRLADEFRELQEHLGQAKKGAELWHNQIQHRRDLYNLKHYKETPKSGEVQYADPTYTNAVDLTVGIVLANRMDWSAYGWSPTAAETKDTSKIEKYLIGLLEINNERNEYLIPYEVDLHFARDGTAVLYSVWDTELEDWYASEEDLPDPESESGLTARRVFDMPPIRVEVIDPLKIFPMQGGPRRWARIFRVEMMSVRDVELAYGVKIDQYAHLGSFDKATTKDEFIDVWEFRRTPPEVRDLARAEGRKVPPFSVYNAVIYGRQFVEPPRLMEGYEDLPYRIGFFKPTERENAEGWGHSIIDPMESSLSLLERAINRRDRQINVYSSLPMFIQTRSNRAIQVDPALNAIQLGEGEQIGYANWPGNPPDVQLHADFLRSRVQQAGYSDVMYGAGNSQVTGYALSQLGDQNRIRLTQPVEHLKLLWSGWAQMVLRLTAHFARNSVIQVYGEQRGVPFSEQVMGEELEGYRVRVKIEPTFPNEEVRKTAMATQVRGQLSNETIMSRYLGVEQPDDERKRLLREMAQAHPMIQNYVMLSTLKELAEGGDEAAQMALDQIRQAGVPGQPGRPVEPRAQEQLLGTPGPTGQPTPQEQGLPPPGQSEEDQLQQAVGAAPELLTGGV